GAHPAAPRADLPAEPGPQGAHQRPAPAAGWPGRHPVSDETESTLGAGETAGAAGLPTRPRKAPTALRTISEVSDDLHIPQHVLRFWETKFPQLKPLKRGGGRRYYRPEDIALLRRVSDLLYTQGYTIKGVQRLLREGGLEGATGSPA